MLCGLQSRLDEESMLKSKLVASMVGYVFVAALCAAFLFASPVGAAPEKTKPAGAENQTVKVVDPALVDRLEKMEKFQHDFERFVEFEPTRREYLKDLVDGKLQAQDKLLAITSGQIDRFSIIVSLFGVLIALGLGLAGYLGYGKAISEAKKSVKEWFDGHEKYIAGKIDPVLKRIELASNVAERIIVKEKEANCSYNNIKKVEHMVVSGRNGDIESLSSPDIKVEDVILSAKSTQSVKVEEAYTVDDRLEMGLAAYFESKYYSAIASLDEVASSGVANDAMVSTALFYKGLSLARIGNSEGAIHVYDEICQRFWSSTDLSVRTDVAASLYNKGVRSRKLGRIQDELDAYDVAVGYVGDDESHDMINVLARALHNKGKTLCDIGNFDGALLAFREIVKRVRSLDNKIMNEQFSRAKNGIGFVYIVQAKQLRGAGGGGGGLLREAIVNFDESYSGINDKQLVLGNKGYALFLLGRTKDARIPLLQALTDGGERMYKLEMEDSYIHPVPEDEDFRKLLAELWREAHGTEPPVIDPPKKDEATPPSSS